MWTVQLYSTVQLPFLYVLVSEAWIEMWTIVERSIEMWTVVERSTAIISDVYAEVLRLPRAQCKLWDLVRRVGIRNQYSIL